MPTIGEVYNPLIDAAKAYVPGDLLPEQLLLEVGILIFKENPDKCSSVEEGVAAAKSNLTYYIGYYDKPTREQVQLVYNL